MSDHKYNSENGATNTSNITNGKIKSAEILKVGESPGYGHVEPWQLQLTIETENEKILCWVSLTKHTDLGSPDEGNITEYHSFETLQHVYHSLEVDNHDRLFGKIVRVWIDRHHLRIAPAIGGNWLELQPCFEITSRR